MTAAECLTWLAERTMLCPQQVDHKYLDGMPESVNYIEDGAVCSTCDGTGRVPMFPTLRRECSCKGTGRACSCGWPLPADSHPHRAYGNKPAGTEVMHKDCQGRGQVVAEVHLEDLLPIGFQVFESGINFQPTADGSCVVSLTIGGNIGEKAATPKLALLLCIVAAVKAQEEKV